MALASKYLLHHTCLPDPCRIYYSTICSLGHQKQADFQKNNGSSNLRSYLHVTTFAELQVWHFMIICNGLTSGYALYNSVFEKRNESADGECQKIPKSLCTCGTAPPLLSSWFTHAAAVWPTDCSCLLSAAVASEIPEYSGHQYWTKRLKFPPKCMGTFGRHSSWSHFRCYTWELWCNNEK